MDKNSVAEALRALAGSESRSETSRLREVFDEVETALSAGVSRTAILETLHEQGFTMTAKSFESALYRLRKQREAGKLPKAKAERVHGSLSSAAENRAATPQSFTPKREAESGSENTGNSASGEQTSIEQVAIAGKTKTEQVLATAPKAFSFKQQLQQAKDSK